MELVDKQAFEQSAQPCARNGFFPVTRPSRGNSAGSMDVDR